MRRNGSTAADTTSVLTENGRQKRYGFGLSAKRSPFAARLPRRCYDCYSPDRKGEHPNAHLAGFKSIPHGRTPVTPAVPQRHGSRLHAPRSEESSPSTPRRNRLSVGGHATDRRAVRVEALVRGEPAETSLKVRADDVKAVRPISGNGFDTTLRESPGEGPDAKRSVRSGVVGMHDPGCWRDVACSSPTTPPNARSPITLGPKWLFGARMRAGAAPAIFHTLPRFGKIELARSPRIIFASPSLVSPITRSTRCIDCCRGTWMAWVAATGSRDARLRGGATTRAPRLPRGTPDLTISCVRLKQLRSIFECSH